MLRRPLTALVVALGLVAGRGVAAGDLPPSPGATAPQKVVFQVSDADPQKWALALNNIRNVADDLGAASVVIELVAYGPGIAMLKADSPVARRVAEALDAKVRVVACENTMKAMKLGQADMLPAIGYVPAGVVELMKKQREGWAYIRP